MIHKNYTAPKLRWAVADEELNLLERGVRLFDSLDDNGELQNAIRRQKRSIRRQTSRRKNLKKDFVKLLAHQGVIDKREVLDDDGRLKISLERFAEQYINGSLDILQARMNATKNKVANSQEAISILYWYLSHRGFQYEVADENEDDAKNLKAFGGLLDPNKLVVENQMDYFLKNCFYRSALNRSFSTKQYLRELDIVLSNIGFTNEFTIAYKKLFERRRSFEEGPGPKDEQKARFIVSRGGKLSPFGRFYQDEKTNEVKPYNTVWEKTTGKCSIYAGHDGQPALERAAKSSIFAQLFNLLNDLNTLSIGHSKEKLTKDQKNAIINISLKNRANVDKTIKYLKGKDQYDDDELLITGFRVKQAKDGPKNLLTQLDAFHDVNKALVDAGLSEKKIVFQEDFEVFNFIDELIMPCYVYKEIEKRVDEFSKLNWLCSVDEAKLQKLAKGLKVPSATHSLSLRALHEYSELLLSENDNFAQLSYDRQQMDNGSSCVKRKYISLDWVDKLIASPTIKRGIRQAVKVLNAIIKNRDYEVHNIVIEMARETNDKQAKDNIKETQKALSAIAEQIKSDVQAFQIQNNVRSVSGGLLTKLWLFAQQNGLDPYDGQPLDRDSIIKIPNYVDIDHIIPYSQSFDDSRNNKVLTKKEHNAAKANMTAYQYVTKKFGETKYAELALLWKKMFISHKSNNQAFVSQKKFIHLNDRTDYSNPANTFGFIGRNLVDTRYIAREVLAKVQRFIFSTSEGHLWHNAKVKTINGKMTSFIGKLVDRGPKRLERPDGFENDGRIDEKTKMKIRDWNGHHSEDAFIILHGALKNAKLNKYIEKTLSNPYMEQDEKEKFSNEMQKRYTEENLDFEKRMDIHQIREQLNATKDDVKFSYMQTTRNNRKFSNETLYRGHRDQNGQLRKVERIKLAGASKEDLLKIFNDDYKHEIPMKEFDSNTFKALKQIFILNQNEKFPFAAIAAKDSHERIEVNVGSSSNSRKIRSISVIKSGIKDDLEIIKTRNNGDSFYESMEWLELRLFRDINGKNQIIPINATNSYFGGGKITIKEKEYSKYLQVKNIDPHSDWVTLKKGTTISDGIHLYRIVGNGGGDQQIQIKRIDGLKIKDLWGISSDLKEWSILEVSALGDKKKIANF